jgi:hypothetical protein
MCVSLAEYRKSRFRSTRPQLQPSHCCLAKVILVFFPTHHLQKLINESVPLFFTGPLKIFDSRTAFDGVYTARSFKYSTPNSVLIFSRTGSIRKPSAKPKDYETRSHCKYPSGLNSVFRDADNGEFKRSFTSLNKLIDSFLIGEGSPLKGGCVAAQIFFGMFFCKFIDA